MSKVIESKEFPGFFFPVIQDTNKDPNEVLKLEKMREIARIMQAATLRDAAMAKEVMEDPDLYLEIFKKAKEELSTFMPEQRVREVIEKSLAFGYKCGIGEKSTIERFFPVK